MTSSLKYRFDFSDKRAICIAGDRVIVYHWHRGTLTDSYVFTADDNGRAQFERYLLESTNVPAYMLVDVVEEEYRQETIPHVFGKDRSALLKRKQGRLFRGARYCHALMQGRESEGRRDDRVLLTGLMNDDMLTPWVRLLEQNKVPLAGIYSLPILSALLLRELGIEADNCLLVTLQSASGLRQSFFRSRDLKISRLAKAPRLGTVPFGEYLLGELEKLRRYLNSLRLVTRDAPLEVCVLSHGHLLEDLRAQCRNTEAVRYHLLDVEEVAGRLGITEGAESPYSDRLFAHLLLRESPSNHYANSQETRYFSLHRARIATLAASVLLVLGSVVWGGFTFMQGVSLKQRAMDAAQKADFYQARYEMARESLPPTAVEPRAIQTAVDIVDALERHKTTPLALMEAVSAALSDFSAFRIEEIEWVASADPGAAVGDLKRAEDAYEPREGEPRYDLYQIGLVSGRIARFDGDYRAALGAVNRFAEALRAQRAVTRVQVIGQPLDLSSEASLEGAANPGSSAVEATFSVLVTMGMGDGEV